MARITLSSDLEGMSGKLCRKGTATYAQNKKTGKVYRYDYHERPDPNTADQQQVRAKFKARVQAAATWYNANKPSTTNTNGTADFQKVKAAYDAQHKIGNIFSFVRSLVSGTTPAVVVPGGSTTTTGGGTTQGGANDPISD